MGLVRERDLALVNSLRRGVGMESSEREVSLQSETDVASEGGDDEADAIREARRDGSETKHCHVSRGFFRHVSRGKKRGSHTQAHTQELLSTVSLLFY